MIDVGRRRKKKVIKIYKPKIPTVFICPICGNKSLNIKIQRKKKMGAVFCGSCNVKWEANLQGFEEKIDIYHKFFDAFSEGKL